MPITARTYRTEAVVVRRTDIGEADRIITLYTPAYGKVRAIARGARRPHSKLGGSVELFTHTQTHLAKGRDLDIITQAEIIRPYHHIRDDLWLTSLACYVAELVDRLNEFQQPNPLLFSLLCSTLSSLDKGGQATSMGIRQFEIQLLGLLGYSPELYQCTVCGKDLKSGQLYYGPSTGGVICSYCGPGQMGVQPASVSAIKTLRLLADRPFGIASRLRVKDPTVAETEELLEASITFTLERRPNAAKFLHRLKADGLAPTATNPGCHNVDG